MQPGRPYDYLYVMLFCEEADVPEIVSLVERCHMSNTAVGDA
jgi:hypothetical protein